MDGEKIMITSSETDTASADFEREMKEFAHILRVCSHAARMALTNAAKGFAREDEDLRWKMYEALLSAGKRAALDCEVPWEQYGKALSEDLLRVIRLD